MVLRYWGATGVFPEDFRPLVRPEEGGIRAEELAGDLQRRGWWSESFRGDGEWVRSRLARGRPVIALIQVAPERYHFVVIVAWTDDGVLYHDPARAPFLSLSPEEFEDAWSPTDRWALLVQPHPRSGRSTEPRADSAVGIPDGAEGRPSFDDSGACTALVSEAVTLSRAGDHARAAELLQEAVARCPESGRVRAELAGVYASRAMWNRAREAAEVAVRLSPASTYGWRILATSRYLTGDRLGALDAWNRVDEPRIERIRLVGLEGTRHREVEERIGLELDQILSPRDLTRAARRLNLLPSAAATALRYRPRQDGRVEVVGAVVQRSVFPSSPVAWGTILVRGLVSRDWKKSHAGSC